ncbi:hypothetical protein [Candidatus Laterigemmans baculatus]|uniref:hypothetical protein n=1 Tax=Candidatus Laterigemmans baculatus TaxID=2770505 RepID=UPI0013DBE117|nr:hypothetical protein [Candidatus Laterigemmans baculatus]
MNRRMSTAARLRASIRSTNWGRVFWGRVSWTRVSWRWASFALLLSFGSLLHSSPSYAAPAPTGRSTTDRDADLIAALIAAGQTEAAVEICQRHLAANSPGSAANAVWSIRLSAARVAALQAAGVDDDAAWDAAREPLEAALRGYESEPPAPWLELQRWLVSLARSHQRAMRYLANPTDAAVRDRLLTELRTTVKGLRALESRLAEIIPLADNGRLETAAPAADLIHLQQTVRRRIVEALLLRADAYPAGSDDALAAATEAEQLAGSLLDAGTGDLESREAAVRTWAETRRRSENPQAAVELLNEWLAEHGSLAPETRAQLVLAELQAGNRERAAELVQAFYGDDPSAAPASTEMDLARLRFLLDGQTDSTADRQQAAAWIDQIARRSGAYARRRAETEVLRVVRVRPSEGNATLMAARAGQLLREGGEAATLQAARLLGEASAAIEDPADGFRWGLQSAAAFAKLQRHAEASRAFATTALRWPEQPQASAVHFEAARQWSQQIAQTTATPEGTAPEGPVPEGTAPADAAAAVERLEAMLVEHLRRWPATPEAEQARQWLLKLYEASQRYDRAARVVLQLPADAVAWPEALAQAGRLWRQALAATESAEARAELAREALATLGQVPPEQAARAVQEANLIAALTLSREALQTAWQAPPQASTVAGDTAGAGAGAAFANDLRRLRLEAIDPRTVALATSNFQDSQTVIELALQRLRDDALENPEDRSRLARGMLRLVEGSGDKAVTEHPLVADALALSGQWQEAAARWERLASDPNRRDKGRRGELLRHGAEVLGSLGDPAAQRRAIEIWNRLAQGLPQGTAPWHEAKLAAARLLEKTGQREEAARLAKFVLLTQPPEDPALRAEYQRLAN